jgi:hypothetical protein
MRRILFLVSTFLLIYTNTMASTIVDTGTTQANLPGSAFRATQWVAGKFNLNQDSYITGLYGWLWNSGNTGDNFTISIYDDGGEIPNTNSLLYSNSASISGDNNQGNWEGYDITWTDSSGNTGKYLSAGNYWLSFEIRSNNYDNLYDGRMPKVATTPLKDYAFAASNNNGKWYGDDTLDFAVRVLGTPAAVPEPATVILFGIGLLGLAGVSRKKQ